MHKLFHLSFLRIFQRLGSAESNLAELDQLLVNNNISPSGQDMLYRLPRQEFKHILNMTCPVNSLEQNHAAQIIRASKTLRHHAKMDEKKICFKCPFVATCPSARIQLATYSYNNTLKDLLIYFHGLQNFMNPDAIYYRQWVSGYKLGDSVIAAIEDLSKQGVEIKQYQRLRLLAKEQHSKKRQAEGEQGEHKYENSNKKKVSKLQDILQKHQKVRRPTQSTEQVNRDDKLGANQIPKIKQVFGKDYSFDQQEQFEPTNKFTKQSVEKNEAKSSNTKDASERPYKKKETRLQTQNEGQEKPKLRKIQIQNRGQNDEPKVNKRQKMSNYYGTEKDVQERINKPTFRNKYSEDRQGNDDKRFNSRNKYSDDRQGSQNKSSGYKNKYSEDRQGKFERKEYDPRAKYSNNNDSYGKGNYSKNKYSDNKSGEYDNNKGYNHFKPKYGGNRYEDKEQGSFKPKYGGNRYEDKQQGSFKPRYGGNRYEDKEQGSFKPRYNKYNQNRSEDDDQSQNPRIKQTNRGEFVRNNRPDRNNEEKSPFVVKWNEEKPERINKVYKNAYDEDTPASSYKKVNKNFTEEPKYNKPQEQVVRKAKAEPKMVDMQNIQSEAPRVGRKVTRRRSSTQGNDQQL